jgi:hypothetical protein
MSFENLKRGRGQIAKLVAAADAAGGDKKNYTDDRFWKPTVDKANNGYAVIRFLPVAEGNDLPWNRYWDHGFKGPGGQWYIEKSLTSIGGIDPVGELNSRLWNSGIDSDKEVARKQKRRLHHVSNIYVVSDPGNADNEGKTFLYQYGKKIFDKLMDAMQPEFADEAALNPFDFWEGANFKLKIREVEGYRNYDKSEFADPSALSDDDSELEKIYAKMYDLNEFLDPANYKSYDDLKARMNTVLGQTQTQPTMREEASLGEEMAPREFKSSEAPSASTPSLSSEGPASESMDDTMSYFATLASED